MGKRTVHKSRPPKGRKKTAGNDDNGKQPPKTRMRREIVGICLFFLLVFTLVSLLSYRPSDTSFNTAAGKGEVHNLFGVVGAYFAGGLVDAFGLGAFWIPLLLLVFSLQFFTRQSAAALVATAAGGLLLVVATGGLFSLWKPAYEIFGSRFSSGGLTGIPLETLLSRYTNPVGAAVILSVMFLVGFILATRFSLVVFARRFSGFVRLAADRAYTQYLKRKERSQKARRRQQKKAVVIQKEREVRIEPPAMSPVPEVPVPRQEVFDFMRGKKGFQLPSAKLLDDAEEKPTLADQENLRMQSKLLEKKLEDFGVNGQVVTISPGPVITTFEYEPAPGVKINRVVNLADDLALALRAASIRIVAPIPGKAVIGIEIPNIERQIVRFKGVVVSSDFEGSKSKLTMCLGRDIVGNPVVADLTRMPHLLIAGATGTGKSVGLNAMICSFLYKATPDEVKLIMIDPKRIELSLYDGIPYLITPVVTDVKKATNALYWAVKEMERRYELLSEKKVRNIQQFNKKIEKEIVDKPEEGLQPLPLIAIVIDELADLMMAASRDVEMALTRLAQMARAAGIHLILATQRPSVDVLTGIIKANFPTRLTFQVSSKTDSRTIIDTNGAENLLGAGDMLFVPPGTSRLQRIHGAFISEAELVRITDFLKRQGKPEYDQEVTQTSPREQAGEEAVEHDERYDDAVALVTKTRQASISMIQRHLRVGYNRAARMIEVMEKEGIVGPSDGVRPREVLVRGYDEMG
jgi:S-DNA-T family DNA segregation ATPase FtsK/SpoIIIE